MGRFERPDPLLEPGEQAASFSQATKKSLSEVDMALYQAGKNKTAGDVERPATGWSCAVGPDGGDAAILDQYVAAAVYRGRGIQRENSPASKMETVGTALGPA